MITFGALLSGLPQYVLRLLRLLHAQAAGKEDDEEEKEDGEITEEDRLQKRKDDHAAAQLELKVCAL